MTKPSTTVVNIRLDTGTIEAIRAVAVEEGRTWAGQVRYILAGWMRARSISAAMDDEDGQVGKTSLQEDYP